MNWQRHIFELTPLGKADSEVRRYLGEKVDETTMDSYNSALQHYRHTKLVQTFIRVLLYASIITSFAATFGLDGQIEIIQRVASYIGTTFLLVLYAVSSYITMIRKENYHVQREILISKAEINREKI